MSSSDNNQTSTGGKEESVQGGANTAKSGLSGPNFDSLYSQKRSNDPDSVAKRENIEDQKPPQGFIGNLFSKYVSGSTGPNTNQNT